jgi:hypothetical protein
LTYAPRRAPTGVQSVRGLSRRPCPIARKSRLRADRLGCVPLTDRNIDRRRYARVSAILHIIARPNLLRQLGHRRFAHVLRTAHPTTAGHELEFVPDVWDKANRGLMHLRSGSHF